MNFRDCLPIFRAFAHVPQGLDDRRTHPFVEHGIPIADEQGDKDAGSIQPSVLMLLLKVYYTTGTSIHSVGVFERYQISSLSSSSRESRSRDPEQIESKMAIFSRPG